LFCACSFDLIPELPLADISTTLNQLSLEAQSHQEITAQFTPVALEEMKASTLYLIQSYILMTGTVQCSFLACVPEDMC
jgi:hypothetical protein